MKRFCVVLVIGYLCLLRPVYGQAVANSWGAERICSNRLSVGFNKTTNLIFPFPLKSVDRGSQDIIVQKAKGVTNILQVKADREGFPETNLSIVTTDGKFYSFLVNYNQNPDTLNLSFAADSLKRGDRSILAGEELDAESFELLKHAVEGKKSFLHLHKSQQRVDLALSGIYLVNNAMLFSFKVRNKSLVGYVPEFTRFSVVDKRRAKRTAIQEREIIPLYGREGNAIGGSQSVSMVVAFEAFTIASSQELLVQIGEKNGGRLLQLHISARRLLKARPLNY